MADPKTTTIRLSPEGRAIQVALQAKLSQRLGPVTLGQVIEYALRQVAVAEGIELTPAPAARPKAPAKPRPKK